MLLVRKKGTEAFMQPGGKIDDAETPSGALIRELREELGVEVGENALSALGRFQAAAANEAGHKVDADVFRLDHDGPFRAMAEIEEVLWYPPEDGRVVALAPLTRDCVMPASGG